MGKNKNHNKPVDFKESRIKNANLMGTVAENGLKPPADKPKNRAGGGD